MKQLSGANPARLEERHLRRRVDRDLLKYGPREGRIAVSVSIKPLEDRVVIKQVGARTVTASGLVIPDMAKEKSQEDIVVAMGPGRVDDKGVHVPIDVKEGDKVICAKYSGTEVKYQSEEYIILSTRDLLAVVE